MNKIKGLLIAAAMFTAAGLLVTSHDVQAAKKSTPEFKTATNKDKKSVTIVKYMGKKTNVVIPKKIDGKTVTCIGRKAFANNEKIKSVSMPDTVEDMSVFAFSKCSSLKKVKLSKNIKSIGIRTFFDCEKLATVNIPEGVKTIEYAAFKNCKSLKKADLKNVVTIKQNAFDGAVKLSGKLELNSVENVGEDAFLNCKKITDVIFSDCLQTMGDHHSFIEGDKFIPGMSSNSVFFGCESLLNITVDEKNPNFQSADGVLYGKGLQWLVAFPGGRPGAFVMPDTVEGISDDSFAGAHISDITISKNVYYYGNNAFYQSFVKKLVLPDISNQNILDNQKYFFGHDAFCGMDYLESIQFPQNIVKPTVLEVTFCKNLKQVIFPAAIEKLEGGLCYFDSGLETVTLPDTITEIPGGAFAGCTSLKNINLDKIDKINSYAFYGCTSFTGELKLNASSVGYMAFHKCSGIEKVTFEKPVSALGNIDDSFSNAVHLNRLDDHGFNVFDADYYSYSLKESNPFGNCDNLKEFVIPAESKYTISDGVVYSSNMKKLIACPQQKTGKFIVPYGVEQILTYAFEGSRITDLVISDKVNTVHTRAIGYSKVEKITIGKNVSNLYNEYGKPIFVKCPEIKEFVIKDGNSKYGLYQGTIIAKVDKKSPSLIIAYPPKMKGKKFAPSKDYIIESGAFSGCAYLKEVYMPEGTTGVQHTLFYDCKGIKLYVNKKVKWIDRFYDNEERANDDPYSDSMYYAFGHGCKKCVLVLPKNPSIEKEILEKSKNFKMNFKLKIVK